MSFQIFQTNVEFVIFFITRTIVNITYSGEKTWYDVFDYDTVRALKEIKSKREGLHADVVDLVYKDQTLDDDKQWWDTGVFAGNGIVNVTMSHR